jgi:HSP20 family protein
MDVTNLIPWRPNGRTVPTTRSEETTPALTLHREMNRLFDDFFRGFGMPMQVSTSWPTIEVTDDDNAVTVRAELPGMEEKDVELTLDNGMLRLKGEKKSESESPGYSERWHGSFERFISLGADVEPEKAKATFKNGLLTIAVPKRPEEERTAKRIPITS